MITIDFRKCFSKFDKKDIYLVGQADQYRKFVKTNEHDNTIYIECLKCRVLHQTCDKISTRFVFIIFCMLNMQIFRTIASAIIRAGEIDKSHRIIHNPCCAGSPLEQFVGEQMDRAQRREIGQCSSDLKSLWREVW